MGLASFYINLTQARVIWKEKMIPYPRVADMGRPVHCGWHHPR